MRISISGTRPITILNVDDDEVGRYSITRMLRQAGFQVEEASSGVETLKRALDQPDLIILDVKLPDASGFEICQKLKSNPQTASIPVLHLSARYVTSEDRAQGLNSGADAYLMQPVESLELIATVKALLRIRQAEEVAKTQAQQWQTTFDAISDGVCLLDPVGRILRCNQAMVILLQKPLEEICNYFYQDLLQERLGLGELTFPANLSAGVQHETLELNANDRWFRITKDPVLSDNQTVTSLVYIITDISESKRAEAERSRLLAREQAARAEAEAANRLKDEFLATLSHELRSPLNSMLGWAKMLRTRKLDPAVINRALETIERNARTQTQLVEDLLDVSRIIRGKLHLQVCPLDLVSVIQDGIDALHLAAEAKSIHLEFLRPALTTPVLGDPDRLQQIIWNLLSNALKFTPQGGSVEVRLAIEEKGNRKQGADLERNSIPAYALIQVKDTGLGISQEFLPYVFDRFRQADSTTTRTYAGLGLGLAIVRHLVELHGGTVEAESPGEGLGATFTVRLPLAEMSRSEGTLEQQFAMTSSRLSGGHLPNLEGLCILIVDDEPDTREFMTVILQECGASVTVAASVQEALEAFGQHQPDVLVSDIGMPEEDGYSLIRKIRALQPAQGGKTPAIALTAYAREEDRMYALSLGFQKHLSKPVEPAILASTVAHLSGLRLT